MSRRDNNLALQQMLDYAQEAVNLSKGKVRADLDNERILELAIVRLLEIIGEAANRVPEDIQSAHPEITWFQIISLRNRLIHGYDSIDFDILWSIVQKDLPDLIKKLKMILK